MGQNVEEANDGAWVPGLLGINELQKTLSRLVIFSRFWQKSALNITMHDVEAMVIAVVDRTDRTRRTDAQYFMSRSDPKRIKPV